MFTCTFRQVAEAKISKCTKACLSVRYTNDSNDAFKEVKKKQDETIKTN